MTAYMRMVRPMAAHRAAELDAIRKSAAGPQRDDTLARLNRHTGKD